MSRCHSQIGSSRYTVVCENTQNREIVFHIPSFCKTYDFPENIAVHYIGSKQPAEEWARDVIRPLIGRDVAVVPASPVIGVHVGPAVGIAYECDKPMADKFTSVFPEVVSSDAGIERLGAASL